VAESLLSASFDFSEVDAALKDTWLRAQRLAPAFRQLAKPLRADQRDHAMRQAAPGGSWPGRSAATLARRKLNMRRTRVTKAMRTVMIKKPRRRGAASRRVLGRLPGAFKIVIGKLYVRAVHRVKWAGVHLTGGTVGRGVQLPQREFFWISDKLLATATEKLGSYVAKGMKK
jgi:phage gpG-like protein